MKYLKRLEISKMKEDLLKNYISVGDKVRGERQKQRLSQEQLASRCSVNTAKISGIENARRDFMFSTILELAKGLGIDLKKLMDF